MWLLETLNPLKTLKMQFGCTRRVHGDPKESSIHNIGSVSMELLACVGFARRAELDRIIGDSLRIPEVTSPVIPLNQDVSNFLDQQNG